MNKKYIVRLSDEERGVCQSSSEEYAWLDSARCRMSGQGWLLRA
jgi:hypothetical protein